MPALTTFAIAEPRTKSAPTSAVNATTRNVPVPGPINPSYSAITTPANATTATIRHRVRRHGIATTPSRGRNTTNSATATNTPNTTGRYADAGTAPANAAPTPAQHTANPADGPATAQSSRVRRAYVTAAVDVPAIAASLFVPNAVATGIPGAATSNAGSSNRPPPPTTASTQPANAAAASRVVSENGSTGGHSSHPHHTRETSCGQPHRPRRRRNHTPMPPTATNTNIEHSSTLTIRQPCHGDVR
ncbi:hypothetical protein JD76_01942 [Micromonospora endolithica]|nr:hypothetical protein JD76_01942 [Micromonospora endolithica]